MTWELFWTIVAVLAGSYLFVNILFGLLFIGIGRDLLNVCDKRDSDKADQP